MKTMILSLLLGLGGVAAAAYLRLDQPAAVTVPARAKRATKGPKAPAGIEQFRRCAAGLSRDCEGVDSLAASTLDEEGGDGAEAAPEKSRKIPYKDAANQQRSEFLPIDPRSIKIALEQATLDGACRRGNKRSCATLKKLSGSTETLRKLSRSTTTDCERRRLEACRVRGDLAWAAGEHDEAQRWYDKGRLIARGDAERCSLGKLGDAKRCDAASSALAHFDQRTEELFKKMLPSH